MNTPNSEPQQLTSGSGELLTYHQKKSTSFCDTYIFEPETPREEPCGKLFVLIEIEENTQKASQIAEAIATIAQHEYYKNLQPGVVANFESALAKVNDVLSEIAQHGEISWVGKINAIIAAHKDHHLVLSQTGKVKAFLLRGGEFIEVGEETENSKQDAVRIFESIASGDVMPHDHIIFTTRTLLNTLSIQRIDGFLADNPVLTAIRLIQSTLDLSTQTPACAIFVKVDTVRAIEIETEKDTRYADLTPEELSTASPTKKIQNLYDDIRSRSTTVKAVETTKKIGHGIAVAGQFATHLSKNIFETIRGAKKEAREEDAQPATPPPIALSKDNKNTYGVMQVQKEGVRKKPRIDLKNLPKNIFVKVKNLPGTLKHMPRTSQVLLATSASLLLVFVVSIGIFSTKKSSDAKIAALKQKLDTAQEKVNSASASLIYNDVNGALSLLSQAQDLNQQVLGASQFNAEAAALQDKINQEKNRIAHLGDVQGVVQLADLGGAASTILTGLHLDKTTLYVGRSDNNTVYTVNTLNKTTSTVSNGSTGLTSFVKGIDFPLDNSITFITSSGELGSFSTKDKTITKIDAKLNGTPKDIASYGSRYLYALMPATNEIVKLTKSFSGFGQPSSWLKKTSTSLADAVSLAVDGNVYVLRQNGVIVRFLKGTENALQQPSLTKPFVNPTKIYTTEALTNIYILEGSQKRIVVIDKNGTFVKELISDSFQNANDFLVDESLKQGFVTVGTKVFSFPLVLK